MDVGTADPRTFHLTSQGQDVAIYVAGEADGSFDQGDFILFYGQKFRGTVLAERYADEMAPWLALCPACRLAGLLEKYTDENVYWLTAGGAPGPRMVTKDGTPSDSTPVPPHFLATVHAEESHWWWTWHFTSEDTWFWDRVQTGSAGIVTRTYTTTLTAPDLSPSPSSNRGWEGEGYTATVRAEVVALSFNPNTAPDHHTRFYFNGALLEDGTWDGPTRHHVEAAVSQNVLHEGENALDFVIHIDACLSADDIFFDWFEVTYPRRFVAAADQLTFTGDLTGTWRYELTGFAGPDIQVYDVTDPIAPQRVLTPTITATGGTYTVTFQDTNDAGARYLAVGATAVQSPRRVASYIPPDLTSPTNGADYIFITHRDFYTATQTLATYRQAQGLRTIVVDVDDLYNEFNDGIYHPIAIRNFLAYAYAHWQPPAPSYVLLVGDGHWNFKGYGAGPVEPIYMPPNLAFADPWQGEVDSANLLAAVVGNDILPDLFIGRLPVNSVGQLKAIISKIMAYESAGPQDWQRHVLFVADNVPDAAGDFVTMSNDIAAQLPARCQVDRIYLNDYCGAPASPPQPCPAVNNAITSTLNITGALLVNYIGHGAIERWAHEQIFTNSDIPSLVNGDRLPVVLSMTCLDGYWTYPNHPCLAEELLQAEGRGAVATWSPTGLGVATGHEVLDRGFYTAVFRDGVRQLGPATLAGKLALYATGGNCDLIHTFTIFGDPALHLPVPPWQVYLPIICK
jgi:hypothetical protein